MIEYDDFDYTYGTDEDDVRYKFRFCIHCKFYECELIAEYVQLKGNNPITAAHSYDKENPTMPPLSYNPNELEHDCSFKHFIQKECARQRVAEGIGDDFKANIRGKNYKIESDAGKYTPKQPGKWEPKQPVFISAQTGQGKNYFIENALLPYVRDMNIARNIDQKVLVISNRIALKLQIRNRLVGIRTTSGHRFA